MTPTQFDKYIGEIRAQMLRFANSILGNRADAEDVVAQVSERLWLESDRLEPNPKAKSFAMTSVRNGCYDFHRYRELRRHDSIEQGAVRAETTKDRDTVELVRFAISKLPEPGREILHLKDIEGYSTAEIAQIYDMSEAAVRMALSRSRQRLKEIIIGIKKL